MTKQAHTVSRAWALSLCLAGSATLITSVAGASAAANSFKLSGAGKGTISEGPVGSCLAGKEGGGIIEIDDLVGSVKGYSGVASWTVVINENKNGSFKLKPDSTKDPQLALNDTLKNHNLAQGDKADLEGTSGTVVVHGSAGSVNSTVRNLSSSGYGKTIKISGSWTCPA